MGLFETILSGQRREELPIRWYFDADRACKMCQSLIESMTINFRKDEKELKEILESIAEFDSIPTIQNISWAAKKRYNLNLINSECIKTKEEYTKSKKYVKFINEACLTLGNLYHIKIHDIYPEHLPFVKRDMLLAERFNVIPSVREIYLEVKDKINRGSFTL